MLINPSDVGIEDIYRYAYTRLFAVHLRNRWHLNFDMVIKVNKQFSAMCN